MFFGVEVNMKTFPFSLKHGWNQESLHFLFPQIVCGDLYGFLAR